MPLRVTRNGMYYQTQAVLGRNTRRMMDLQQQLATFRRVNRPSDDPTAARRILQLREDASRYDRYLANIRKAEGRLDHATAVLESISSCIGRVRSLAMQAGNPDVSPDMRRAIADEVDTVLQGIIDDANTAHEGRYLFAGAATDTKPFVSDTAPGGRVTDVSYEGDTGAIWVSVGPEARTQINESGYDVFMAGGSDGDLFNVIAQTRDLVANEEGLSDADVTLALSAKLADIDRVHGDLLASTGRLAGRAKSLELRQSLYEDIEIATARSLADEEDADIAEVVYKLQMERNQFEALLAGSAALLGPTLMDFLK